MVTLEPFLSLSHSSKVFGGEISFWDSFETPSSASSFSGLANSSLKSISLLECNIA